MGHGFFGIEIAKRNRSAEITALDWQAVLDVARENAAAAGVASRFRTIAGSAFKNAKGAFQVQQNNAINSSTQQNMAIAAVNAPGGNPFGVSEQENATLSHTVSFNTALNVPVTGFNQIDDHAFAHAAGAFQVQQNSSTNSAVSQNMSIIAVTTTGRH